MEVEDEIADAIMEEHRIDENTRRKQWAHTYSLDESPGLEYHFLAQASSSEEILLQRESDQYQEFLLSRLDEALAIKMVQRSKGKSAVAAAAYRSGTKLVNAWDGMTHDYTRKGGIIHSESNTPILSHVYEKTTHPVAGRGHGSNHAHRLWSCCRSWII